jgi:1,4-dihydroxy-2-naphthoate octaprenyltransferase
MKDIPQWGILLLRFIVAIAGALITKGKIPTGVEGLGEAIGPVIGAAGFLFPAGEKNKP